MARLDDVAAALEARLGARVERDVPSGPMTTYRVGGTFAVLVRARSEDDVAAVGEVLDGADVPTLVVGRGSNLLVADAGFPGVALVLAGDLDTLTIERDEARVLAGGPVALPVLARRAAVAGLAGLEFYVGIPGSVGGAVRMNAGGHGRETREVLVGARVLDLRGGGVRTVGVADLELGYRRSSLGPTSVVLGAELAGVPDDAAACQDRVDAIVRWRREHQPGGANAGSVFTNPPDEAAGRLVDVAGCKGRRVGGAVVSEKHANFILAERGATAADVRRLIVEVRDRVAATTGVVLRPELQMVGFARDALDIDPVGAAAIDRDLTGGETR